MKSKELLFVTLIVFLISVLPGKLVGQENTSITIQDLIEASITKSYEIQNINYQADQADINKKKAMSAYLPTVTLDGTYTHLNDDIMLPEEMCTLLMGTQALLAKEQLGIPFNMALPEQVPLQEVSPIQEQDILKVGLSANMVLFSGLEAPYLMKAATHQKNSMILLSEQQKSDLIKEIATTYYSIAVVDKSEEVLLLTEQYLNEQERFVDKAIENGLATNLDKQKINIARQQLSSTKVELNSSRELLIASLAKSTDYSKEELSEIHPDLSMSINTNVSRDVNQRADLKALDEAILATEYQSKSEISSYIPKVYAFAHHELLDDDLSAFDPQWYVGVGVKWTIFDRFSAYQDAQQTKINTLILENQRTNAEELLELNFQKVSLELEKNNQLVELAEENVEYAELAYNLSNKEFELGMRTLNEHLENTTLLEEAQLQLIEAEYNKKISEIEYLEATGNLTIENL